jgi:hypothetical protein
MKSRLAGVSVGLAMLIGLPQGVHGLAQEQKETPKEVTLIGCVELERDYRARKDTGRGGVLGSGVGVGNEFVLSNAKPGRTRRGGPTAPAGDYELTGRHERDFLRHVGRQVEVVGILEKSDDGIDRIDVSLWHPVGDYCPPAK